MTGMVNTNPTSLHMLMLFITWFDIIGGQVKVIVSPAARATDLPGDPLPATRTSQGNAIMVSQDNGAVYIAIPR